MRIIWNICVAIITICICVGCGAVSKSNNERFSVVAYEPLYASGFVIAEDEDENTLVRVTRPWQGDALVEQTLAIFAEEESAVGYRGQYVVGDVERVVCMSSSHVAMLDAIGAVDRVVGVSGKEYIINSAIVANDAVVDVGYDSNLDYEALGRCVPMWCLCMALRRRTAL